MQFKGKKLRTIDLCICSTTKNKIRQEIISKLTEEELSNVNINELVEDITGGIKYAKKVDKKGNGYIIVNNGGGDCISYSYYCGDKEVYSTFVLAPLKKFEIKDFIKENKKAIVCGIFITTLIIADIIYFIKYKKSKKTY